MTATCINVDQYIESIDKIKNAQEEYDPNFTGKLEEKSDCFKLWHQRSNEIKNKKMCLRGMQVLFLILALGCSYKVAKLGKK